MLPSTPLMTTDTDPIFVGLNEQQKLAVDTLKGPVLILAGAGSGKTRTITHRIAHLMAQGVPAWQILAVTFTNKAAKELKERIGKILKLTDGAGTEANHLPMSGTFHSICCRILRRDIEQIGRNKSFVIYDSDDQQKIVGQILKDMSITPEELKPRTALAHIGGFKSEGVRPDKARSRGTSHTEARMAEIYTRYQKALLEANAVDFDDLLMETVRLFEERPDVLARYQGTWKFLHVDEYQDTNNPQYRFISLLAAQHRNLCVIGDPDQSIYSFRGADIRNILDFQREYPDAVSIKLERNYRSTQQILDAADAVISANPNRPEKKMWTEKKDGAKVSLQEVTDERRESEVAVKNILAFKAQGISLADQVILYRTNAQSRLFEEACLRAGVPYRILGGLKFYARKEVKDVLAYLYTVLNPSDTLSLLRIINVPSRKIGDTTMARLQNFSNERSLSLWQSLKHIEMVDGISEGVKNRIADFTVLIENLQQLSKTAPVSAVAESVIKRTGMEKWVRDDTEEGETRWENVQELLSVTKKYDNLPPEESITSFLEEVALISEVDKLDDGNHDAVTLMTLHLCKGLEFSCVTLAGCEEGLLPHSSALMDRNQMEEERRLLYVGMTRAKEHLSLLHASSRTLWGNNQNNARSRFLDDIPLNLIEVKAEEISSKYGWLTSSAPEKKWWKPAAAKNEFSQETASDDVNQDWLDHVEEEISEGTKIEHRTLGTGTVMHRSGDIVEVRFDNGQTKRLALGIAPIKIIATTQH